MARVVVSSGRKAPSDPLSRPRAEQSATSSRPRRQWRHCRNRYSNQRHRAVPLVPGIPGQGRRHLLAGQGAVHPKGVRRDPRS